MNYKHWLPFAVIGAVGVAAHYLANRFKLVLKDTSKSSITEDNVFQAGIIPVGLDDKDPPTGMCTGLELTVENFTREDLEINWSKTYYTINGQTDEGFLHGGGKALRTQMILPRRSDVIFAGSKFKKQLRPTAAIREFEIPSVSQLPIPAGHQTVVAPLGAGEHGIYLCIYQPSSDQDFKVLLSFELARKEKKGLWNRLWNKESDDV